MALLARVPAGRSGRMWLRSRVAVAERGRDQIDRKLRILIPEQERLHTQERLCREAWVSACVDAAGWLERATVLSGQDGVRYATAPSRAQITIDWVSSMGLSYPAGARLVRPAEPPAGVARNAAVRPAAGAFETALLAAARAAAAARAVRLIDAEVASARRQLRALDKRWLPALREALAALELALEQVEQDDGARLRRAVAARPERSRTW